MTGGIRVQPMPKTSVRDLWRMRDDLDLAPTYQRQSGVWNLEKKQLLIDSILNGLDVPKLYFHDQPTKKPRFAVIDGKQRLEALWGFIDGDFPLADDFELFERVEVRAGGMRYPEFGRAYPELLQLFETTRLSIMLVQSNDREMIEEMFSRLNEAVPLNAPEKRNAAGGPLPSVVWALVEHPFFRECIWLENSRYRHLDLASKFLLIEHRGGTTSTKKRDLDELFSDFKIRNDDRGALALKSKVETRLNRLAEIFDRPDRLLSSVGMIVVYFLLSRNPEIKANRRQFVEFDELRERNKAIDRDIQRRRQEGEEVGKLERKLDQNFVTFESYSQSLNDPTALDFRVTALSEYIRATSVTKSK